MKRSILTLVITVFALTSIMASNHFIQDPVKKEIKSEDLPTAVKNAVGDSEYASWSALKIYEVTENNREGEEVKNYEIQVKDATGKLVGLIYDEKGELLETNDL
ncbi:MAG: hypothetical protein AAFN93_13005 [Bacteroidota bacterium]